MTARDQANPVSLSGDPALRRLGEQVRALFRSSEFLTRLFPELPLVVGTGTAAALAWGSMNRVPPSGNVLAQLPELRAEWIGKPLMLSKMSPTGTVFVKSGGLSLDGTRQPYVNGSPTGVELTAAGKHDFTSDGKDWYLTPQRLVPSGFIGAGFPIVSTSASGLTLDTSHVGKYIRFTNGCLVTVPSGIFAPSNEIYLRQAGTGQIVLNQTGIGTSMMTGLLRPPVSFKTKSSEQGATVGLFVITDSTIDVTGHLERF